MMKVLCGMVPGFLVVLLTGSCFETHAGPGISNQLFKGASRARRNSGKPQEALGLTRIQVLREANNSFTFRGKPIRPGLVQEFECWLSDLNPVTMVVDVSAANDANEYADEAYIDGEYTTIKTAEGKGVYGYARVKRAENSVHVLKTRSHGGGSGVFNSELWVKFELGEGMYPDGTPYDQLLLRLIRAK